MGLTEQEIREQVAARAAVPAVHVTAMPVEQKCRLAKLYASQCCPDVLTAIAGHSRAVAARQPGTVEVDRVLEGMVSRIESAPGIACPHRG